LNLPISYFGKLPGYPDFIKFNSGDTEFCRFDEWIQKGMHSAKLKFNDWKSLYRKAPPYNFIIPGKETDKVLAGLLYFSYDKHEREFPFIIFTSLELHSLGLEFHLLPAYLKENADFLSSGLPDRINESLIQPEPILSKTTGEYIKQTYDHFIRMQNQFPAFPENLNSRNVCINTSMSSSNNNYTLYISALLKFYTANGDDELPAVFWSENNEMDNRLFLFRNKTVLDFLNLLCPDYGNIASYTDHGIENKTNTFEPQTLNGSKDV
jgi:type VI secretion system ImpM family protein